LLLVSLGQITVPFSEKLLGIKVHFIQSRNDPKRFLEVGEYKSLKTFEQDNERVNPDLEINSSLGWWRVLLDGKAEVEVDRELTNPIQSAL
jgi:hypothetical protein